MLLFFKHKRDSVKKFRKTGCGERCCPFAAKLFACEGPRPHFGLAPQRMVGSYACSYVMYSNYYRAAHWPDFARRCACPSHFRGAPIRKGGGNLATKSDPKITCPPSFPWSHVADGHDGFEFVGFSTARAEQHFQVFGALGCISLALWERS